MQANEKIKKYYTIDEANAECVRTIRSFAHDADLPIAFIHYKHDAYAQNRKSYKRKNDFSTFFIFVRDGVGFLFGETLYTPRYGETVLVREQVPFSVFGTGERFDYYEIDFPPAFLDYISGDNPFSALFSDGARPPMITPEGKQKEELLALLKKAEAAEGDLLCYSYLIQIAHLLCTGESAPSENPRVPQVLARAMEYMNEHRAEIEGAEDIAKHLGISTTYLSRLFRKALSCTTTEYLNRLRIFRAKELLAEGHSVTEACYGAGFNSYTYFISKFKEETGVTPAKYK